MVMVVSSRGSHNGFSTGFVARHYSEEKLPARYLPAKKKKQAASRLHKRMLTEKEVCEIRKLCDEGKVTQRSIAARFNCSKVTVNKIAHRKVWKNLSTT